MATKKPTAKQIAARKLFAARSKAGSLKKPVGRVSQATGKRPSPRLKARREKSIPGYFANPLVREIEKVGRKIVHLRYLVESRLKESDKWRTVAGFVHKHDAQMYAEALHKLIPGFYIHVEDCE